MISAYCPATPLEQECLTSTMHSSSAMSSVNVCNVFQTDPLPDFQKRVWGRVAAIPYGETRSYLQISTAIGSPRAVRAVGAANGANPVPIVIPCHRVIGAKGRLVGYGGGLAMKKRLLELEGCTTMSFPTASTIQLPPT